MSTLPDLDYHAALANMAGMVELYREALAAFLQEAPLLMQQYREHWLAGDWAVARRAAHSLKSSAAVMGALALSQAARYLEQHATAEDGNQPVLEAAWLACMQAWQRFTQAVAVYLPA